MMRHLSISNIAWPKEATDEILPLLKDNGFSGIEIAPSKIWDDFRATDQTARKDYLKQIRAFDLEICSMHSLFWGVDDIKLFGTDEEKKRLSDYFKELIYLAADLEIPCMVFGSPPVRSRNGIDFETALEHAGEFLQPISEQANAYGTKILIEPLSAADTDFITNHNEGLRLVEKVDSKGFGLHLDAKAICSETCDLAAVFSETERKYEHFHVNENRLGSMKKPKLPHKAMASFLKKQNYQGYASIEMRQLDNYRDEILAAVKFVQAIYGGEL